MPPFVKRNPDKALEPKRATRVSIHPVEPEAVAVFNPFFSLAVNSALLGIEAQQVIALRMLRLAAGGAAAKTEMERMVSEKMIAAAAAATDAAAAGLTGKSGSAIAHQAIRDYRKRIRANKRRLTDPRLGDRADPTREWFDQSNGLITSRAIASIASRCRRRPLPCSDNGPAGP